MLNHRAALRGTVLACLTAGTAAAQGGGEPVGAPLCMVAEYIYAGSRLLAVDRGSVKPTVGFQAPPPSALEGNPAAPLSASVTVTVTSTPGGCPTGGPIKVLYSTTATGTATPGVDYTVVTNASVEIPVGTPIGGGATFQIPLVGDALDEFDETFGVTVGSNDATIGATTTVVTILDDDPLSTLAFGDATATEALANVTATHTITLIPASGKTVTVEYATANNTATAGLDYLATGGTLTFTPGQTSHPVAVTIRPDTTDEPAETYFVNAGAIVNADAETGPGHSDLQALGTILPDADPPPTISVQTSTRIEGDEGTNAMDLRVVLSAKSGWPVTVNYATADGTATTTPPSPPDYVPASGQLSIPAGGIDAHVFVGIVPDGDAEANETLFLNLSPAPHVTIGGNGPGIINNDDPPFQASFELTQGARVMQDLRPVRGQAAKHWYRFGQRARSSYEAVVDATSGDVGAAYGLELKRIAPDLVTVRDHGVAVTPGPLGVGRSKTMRWRNLENFGVHGEFITVNSVSCTTNCGPDDVYRIRFYDTTYAVPRFNNTSSQVTVLTIQNVGSRSFGGTVDFWDANGALIGSQPFFVLEPRASFVLNTSLAMPDKSGSMTIMHEGGYGDLVGKAVSIEPATGFSFDTPIVPRPR